MKNLMKAVIGAENFAKFVWQHSNSETIKSIPEVAELQKDTQERLVALRKSVTTTKKYAEKIDAAANNAMKDIVPLLDDPKTNAKKIAKLTKKNLGGKDANEARNLNNMYRTEIVSRINEYFESHGVDPDGASFAFIRSMEEMKYKNSALVSGPKAHGKLWDAMTMIKYGDSKLNHKTIQRFQGVANRRKLAKDMENGQQNVTFSSDGTVNFGGKTYNVKHFEVLIGAAMTKIGKNFLSEFVLENAIIENGQIIATMKNGCEGNFVFIDIEEAQVRKPFSKIIDCYEVFFNADGTPTGERVKVSNECDDDPVIVDGECINCETIGSVFSADTTSEMNNTNFLLGPNPCDKPNFERNFAKMEELGVFDAALVNKVANWDSLTSREKWNSMSHDDQKMVSAVYQHEIAFEGLTRIEKFFNAVFDENGMKDKLEGIQNGRLFEGGIIGWLEQIPKIFQNKDKDFARRITRKLGISKEDYDLMMRQGAADIAESTNRGQYTMEELQTKLDAMSPKKRERIIANARKNAENLGALATFDKAVRGGSLYQAKKMLLPDLLVIAASFGTDITLTNIRLPRWMGTKIQQLPGLNAIAKTELGNEIGHNYTDFQKNVIEHLNKEVQLTDNVAQYSADLAMSIAALNKDLTECNYNDPLYAKIVEKIEKQNDRLSVLVKNIEKTIDKLTIALEKREIAGRKQSRNIKRSANKFIGTTRYTDSEGKRHNIDKELLQDYKILKQAIKKSKDGDKSLLTAKTTLDSMKRIQKNAIASINHDFGSNVDFAEFSKKITKSKSFDLNIRRFGARNISVKIMVAKYDENGNKIPKKDENNPNIPGKWETHLADNWKDTAKFGKKSYKELNESDQKKFHRLVNEYKQDFQDRMAEVTSLRGMTTVINEYAKATNVRRVQSRIYSMEGNSNSFDNIKEASAYPTLMEMERDSATKDVLLGTYCAPNDCWFTFYKKDGSIDYNRTDALRDSLKTFFGIDGAVDSDGKVAAFKKLQDTGFQSQYNAMTKKIGKAISSIETMKNSEGLNEYVFYLSNGKVCAPQDVQNVLQKGEILYIDDNVTGVMQKRVPITWSMVTGLIKYKSGSTTEKALHGKSDQIAGIRSSLGNSATDQQVIDKMIELGLLQDGQYRFEGNSLLRKVTINGGFKWLPAGVNSYLKNMGTAAAASLVGQALENNNYRTTYPMKDVNGYSSYKESTPKSREKSSLVMREGKSYIKTVDSKGNVVFRNVADKITTNTSSNVSYVNNVTNNIENNYYQIIINQLKSGKTPKEAINIVKAAEWESPMDKKSIIQEIQKIPSNSVVKVEKIKQNSNGKLELSEGAKCPECVAWVFDKAGHLATKYEKDFYAINNDSVQQFIKKVPSIKEFGQMLSHVMAYSLYPQDAQSVRSFLKLNKEYVYPESYENAMMILNQVPAHTKMKIVNGHTYRIQHTYSIVNGKHVYNSPVLKFEIAPQEDTLYQNTTTKASNIRKSRENLNNTNTTHTREAASSSVDTRTKSFGDYVNVPYNTENVSEGQDGELTITLSNGQKVEGTYTLTRDRKKVFVPN